MQPCPFDIFRSASYPALTSTQIFDVKLDLLDCLNDIKGYKVELEDVTCDELICAYECSGENFGFVMIFFYFN